MRKFLDGLYKGGGILAAICLMIILVIIVAQMIARWAGISFPGSTAYAGYFMAAASFLAFAYALNANSHIRVSLLLNAMGKYRYWGEVWCFAIGTAASCYLAFHAIEHTYASWTWNDISQERDKLPLWIPQVPVAVGAVLMAIAFIDNFISLLTRKNHNLNAEKLEGPEV